MTIILGIDPGTRITGYGILRLDPLEALDFGCIKPPPTLPLEQRYLILYHAFQKLIATHHPTTIAVENQFVLKNPQSTLKLGMAKGMLFLAAAEANLPIFEYPPKKAKLAVVGNGRATKSQVQKMVQVILKLPSIPYPEDAADALAIALCHAHNPEVTHVRFS